MEAIIIIGLFILIVCGIILLFIGSFVMGVILQQFVYFVCFILQIFGYSSFADWAESNNIVLLIICCIISALCVFIPIISGLASRDSSKIRQGIDYDEYTNYSNDNNTNYFWDSYSEDKRKRITFVDASGAYRKWGDSFVDCQGNWCRWGDSFYDYDGNYISWGNPYKDMSGAYRSWGDDFVDGDGNWVHL